MQRVQTKHDEKLDVDTSFRTVLLTAFWPPPGNNTSLTMEFQVMDTAALQVCSTMQSIVGSLFLGISVCVPTEHPPGCSFDLP